MKERYERLSGGFHNEVFYDKNDNRIIRISANGKSAEEVRQELQWMDFLHRNGIPLSKPAKEIELDGGLVKAHFEFVRGNPVDVTNPAHWNERNFEQFGRILGRMHALSKEYRIENNRRPVWTKENPDVFGIKNDLAGWLEKEYDRLMEDLQPYKLSLDTFGLIHNDFHQGNFIVRENGEIVVIDFDECACNWFAQDLAVLFYHAYWQQDSFIGEAEAFSRRFMHHVFSGYQSETELHPDTIAQIPIFLKLREIFLYQLFRRKWDKAHLEDWQEYTLEDLKRKIKNREPYAGVEDFSAYL
ncbi:phosphotransferase enzyme family protein [Bacillus infantis]|uniref:phosphotransferase enzyme family protein n=1 Tax=Bacillus infantis TaxID=324767 RepID=UPI0020A200CE|nr:phosphotransferase [Bacillus infantis]MCP1160938.1 phosphotransferase [Bacillus infantis]